MESRKQQKDTKNKRKCPGKHEIEEEINEKVKERSQKRYRRQRKTDISKKIK